MRTMLWIIGLVAVMFATSCEGPVGPVGPRGLPGEDGEDGGGAEITVYSGTLDDADLVDDAYWEIEVGQNLENWLVIVLVREEPGLAWFEPAWDILEFDSGLTTVAIYTDEAIVGGFDYRIAVAE